MVKWEEHLQHSTCIQDLAEQPAFYCNLHFPTFTSLWYFLAMSSHCFFSNVLLYALFPPFFLSDWYLALRYSGAPVILSPTKTSNHVLKGILVLESVYHKETFLARTRNLWAFFLCFGRDLSLLVQNSENNDWKVAEDSGLGWWAAHSSCLSSCGVEFSGLFFQNSNMCDKDRSLFIP